MTSVGFDSLKIPAKFAKTSTYPNAFTTSLKAISISLCLRTSTFLNKTVLRGNSAFNSVIASLGSQISNIATFFGKNKIHNFYLKVFFLLI